MGPRTGVGPGPLRGGRRQRGGAVGLGLLGRWLLPAGVQRLLPSGPGGRGRSPAGPGVGGSSALFCCGELSRRRGVSRGSRCRR